MDAIGCECKKCEKFVRFEDGVYSTTEDRYCPYLKRMRTFIDLFCSECRDPEVKYHRFLVEGQDEFPT